MKNTCCGPSARMSRKQCLAAPTRNNTTKVTVAGRCSPVGDSRYRLRPDAVTLTYSPLAHRGVADGFGFQSEYPAGGRRAEESLRAPRAARQSQAEPHLGGLGRRS